MQSYANEIFQKSYYSFGSPPLLIVTLYYESLRPIHHYGLIDWYSTKLITFWNQSKKKIIIKEFFISIIQIVHINMYTHMYAHTRTCKIVAPPKIQKFYVHV